MSRDVPCEQTDRRTDMAKRKNTQISNFIKILPIGAELFHANRRTDVQTWRNE